MNAVCPRCKTFECFHASASFPRTPRRRAPLSPVPSCPARGVSKRAGPLEPTRVVGESRRESLTQGRTPFPLLSFFLSILQIQRAEIDASPFSCKNKKNTIFRKLGHKSRTRFPSGRRNQASRKGVFEARVHDTARDEEGGRSAISGAHLRVAACTAGPLLQKSSRARGRPQIYPPPHLPKATRTRSPLSTRESSDSISFLFRGVGFPDPTHLSDENLVERKKKKTSKKLTRSCTRRW
jgi:hypothetical protein